MFRTCSDDYIYIPAGEYRSVETNVSHHPRHTVGMRLFILTLTVMFLSAPNSFAQEYQEKYITLNGKITDEENKTVTGAKITLNQNGVRKETVWSNNMYNMKTYYPSGTYEVEVFYLGCSKAKREIELKKGENITLNIQIDLSDMKSQSISGKITNKETGENLVFALISMTSIQNKKTIIQAWTLEDGTYNIKEIPTGIYNVQVHCLEKGCVCGYMSKNMEVEVKKDERLKLDFQLVPVSEARLYGKVTEEGTDQGMGGATVRLYQNGQMVVGTQCDGAGWYYVEHIPVGTYEIVIDFVGHKRKRMEIEIKESERLHLDFQLKFVPELTKQQLKINPQNIVMNTFNDIIRINPEKRFGRPCVRDIQHK